MGVMFVSCFDSVAGFDGFDCYFVVCILLVIDSFVGCGF